MCVCLGPTVCGVGLWWVFVRWCVSRQCMCVCVCVGVYVCVCVVCNQSSSKGQGPLVHSDEPPLSTQRAARVACAARCSPLLRRTEGRFRPRRVSTNTRCVC